MPKPASSLVKTLRQAQNFVGTSKCHAGHTLAEIKDRANPDTSGYCEACAGQLQLYNHLSAAIGEAATRPAIGLTFTELRTANLARSARWHPKGIRSWSASDWLVAVLGELGELASLLKMRNRERDGLVGNKFSPTGQQIADEIADVLVYLDLLAATQEVDLAVAVTTKFNEVSQRNNFPEQLT
jgi:NTP pyrophosphatase (non-canonical NTP hydrolase)